MQTIDIQPGDVITIKPLNGAAYRMRVIATKPGAWAEIPWLTGVIITKGGAAHKARNRYPLDTDERDAAEALGLGAVVLGHQKAVAPTELVKVERGADEAPVKPLSPVMEGAMRAARYDGYLNKGKGTTTGTIVALMDRGLLREWDPYTRGHRLTTTPAQVWDEAHEEDARRAAEQAAHAEDAEQWLTTVNDGGRETHVRTARGGWPMEVENGGHRWWYIRINGHTVGTAGGDWREARRAADRYERSYAHGEAKILHEECGCTRNPIGHVRAQHPATR